MCCFHLPCNLVVALLGRLTNELSLPHELVPIHAARTTLPTLAARSIHPFTVTPSFVDHSFSFFSRPLRLAPSSPVAESSFVIFRHDDSSHSLIFSWEVYHRAFPTHASCERTRASPILG